jgi:hypothetical protein
MYLNHIWCICSRFSEFVLYSGIACCEWYLLDGWTIKHRNRISSLDGILSNTKRLAKSFCKAKYGYFVRKLLFINSLHPTSYFSSILIVWADSHPPFCSPGSTMTWHVEIEFDNYLETNGFLLFFKCVLFYRLAKSENLESILLVCWGCKFSSDSLGKMDSNLASIRWVSVLLVCWSCKYIWLILFT